MTWTMLARESARMVFFIPTLASVAMIVATEVNQPPVVIGRSREAASITAAVGSPQSIQSACRFVQSLTKLYRPGKAGASGQLFLQMVRNLTHQLRDSCIKSTRKIAALLPRQMIQPVSQADRWLKRRWVPDERGN